MHIPSPLVGRCLGVCCMCLCVHTCTTTQACSYLLAVGLRASTRQPLTHIHSQQPCLSDV
jgi:hypothetical protein